eukprot:5288320-Pleurochrysis_carterae.AAC.1
MFNADIACRLTSCFTTAPCAFQPLPAPSPAPPLQAATWLALCHNVTLTELGQALVPLPRLRSRNTSRSTYCHYAGSSRFESTSEVNRTNKSIRVSYSKLDPTTLSQSLLNDSECHEEWLSPVPIKFSTP